MAEAAQERVQASMMKIVDDIDKNHLRKMQGQMHRCAAECCDNSDASMDSVHNCVEQCSQRLQRAQKYVHSQMNDIQDRLQRCIMTCQDKVKDKILPDTTESEVQKYKSEFESCAVACVDDSISTFPAHLKRTKENLHRQNI